MLADKAPFSYSEKKNGSVLIYWNGKLVTTLRNKEAYKFLYRMNVLEGEQAQLLMARLTGNFKRGNERLGKTKGKRL